MPLSLTVWPLGRRVLWLPLLLTPLAPSVGGVTPHSRDETQVLALPDGEFHSSGQVPLVVPAALQHTGLDTDTRKDLFVRTVLPLVVSENERLRARRERMLTLLTRLEDADSLAPQEQQWLRSVAETYRIEGDPITDADAQRKLRLRVDVVPADLALAQAALESGWGRSVYTRKHRDLFGMTALAPRKSKAPKFATLRESVRVYMRTLNSHAAYKRFRVLRAKSRHEGKPLDGYHLADGLVNYSARGSGYVKKVRALIRANDLDRYAATKLTPAQDAAGALESS